jgi:hypothetical protein
MIMALIDNLVTRFPNGITNVNANTIFNSMKCEDPTIYHTYLEDFDYFVAGSWTVTETQAGATQALTNGNGGLIALVNSAANADVNQIQKIGENFLPVSGKKFFFRALLKVDDATLAALAVGLQVTNADGTLASVTDGVYFSKAAATTQIVFNVRKNTTTGAGSANVIAMASDTYITLEAFYDGGDRFYYGYNGTIVGYLEGFSTYAPDTTIAPVIVVKNGSAVARTLTADYMFMAQER